MRCLSSSLLLVSTLYACITPLHADEIPDRDAFVRVCPRDGRYFELSNGRPYIPIGFQTHHTLERTESYDGRTPPTGGVDHQAQAATR